MTRANFTAVLLALGLALPFAAAAEDAGVFKVPGTDSTIKFYGYAQLDGTVDFGARTPDIENYDWATILPAVPADDTVDADRSPQTYLTARTSRFGIITSTPTKAGAVGVRLEGDFNGPNGFQSETYTNSVVFRLRHAYGTFRGLLVGQTWSTFLDLGAAPDTVDFNGPGSLALVRNPMIRYTLGFSPAMNLQLAVENNRGQQYGPSERFQTVPDLHANLTYGAKWGHVSLRGVGQTYTRQVGAAGSEENKSKLSVAGALSCSLKIGGDTLVAQFSGGPGIGRYLLNALGAGDANTLGFVNVDASDEIQLWTVYAYHVGFTHVWRPGLRSNAVWSQTFIQDAEIDGVAATNATQEQLMQLFVNTFYSFAKNAEVGVEYSFGRWTSFGTPELQGTQNRLSFSLHYNFF
ncbi:MAG TPA: DcaP family trimeric outer membrane transporter [Anaeromyxobacteraceae bacterium]|nr:DcaP family trimeric outer membrane transporter [Anaeromyxobacteraceae bacterium]